MPEARVVSETLVVVIEAVDGRLSLTLALTKSRSGRKSAQPITPAATISRTIIWLRFITSSPLELVIGVSKPDSCSGRCTAGRHHDGVLRRTPHSFRGCEDRVPPPAACLEWAL